MNSTPSNPVWTIRLTALLPPPPTPMTLIFALMVSDVGSSRSLKASLLSLLRSAMGESPLEKFFEQSAQPARDAHERAGADRRATRLAYRVAIPVENQSDDGCARRAV